MNSVGGRVTEVADVGLALGLGDDRFQGRVLERVVAPLGERELRGEVEAAQEPTWKRF